MRFKLALISLLFSVCGTALAQATRPIPSHGDHMRICMDTEERKQPDGQFGSSVERAFSTAFCQCQYDNFPDNGMMTIRQFSDAMLGCSNERKANPQDFIRKYKGRYDNIRESTAALAELAPVPYGERWRHFGKNDSNILYFDTQNVTWNGRTVTTVVKALRDDSSMAFLKIAIDCNKTEYTVLRGLEMRGQTVTQNQTVTRPRPEAINPRTPRGELFYALCLPELASLPEGGAPERGAEVDISSKNMNPPKYPPGAARAGAQGTVVLVIDVDAGGSVTNVALEKSSGNKELDQAAMDASLKWRFKPAIANGQPAAGRIRVPVDFKM